MCFQLEVYEQLSEARLDRGKERLKLQGPQTLRNFTSPGEIVSWTEEKQRSNEKSSRSDRARETIENRIKICERTKTRKILIDERKISSEGNFENNEYQTRRKRRPGNNGREKETERFEKHLQRNSGTNNIRGRRFSANESPFLEPLLSLIRANATLIFIHLAKRVIHRERNTN